jgi:hypothetical protein
MPTGAAPRTHEEKVDAMIRDLETRGMSAYNSAPPLFRLLWKLGLEVPPPLFWSFAGAALVMGGFFGVVWGLMMWLMLWREQMMSPLAAGISSASAGVFFGVVMAAYYSYKRRQLGLPAWKDYSP